MPKIPEKLFLVLETKELASILDVRKAIVTICSACHDQQTLKSLKRKIAQQGFWYDAKLCPKCQQAKGQYHQGVTIGARIGQTTQKELWDKLVLKNA